MRRYLKPDATDENWEYYGKYCPYYGVVNWPQFRQEMDAAGRAEFFQTGEVYLGRLFDVLRASIAPGFTPGRALDFGCGVGRLLIPMAKKAATATGVDVSPSMLREAEKNCVTEGIANVRLVASLDELAGHDEQFDFVHSFIVFQHIRPERGIPLFHRLVELLADGGIGALHLTYSSAEGRRARLKHWLHRKVPLLHAISLKLEGGSFSDPLMDMAEYPLNALFAILQDAGCHRCEVRFTHHGVHGVHLLFKKEPLAEI